MNNLQEQLTSSRVEDENSTVNRLGSQVTFKGLVNGDTVDISVINEQLNLVAEQLRVVLRVEELLVALGSVELQTLANTLAKNVERRVSLHNLGHSLLDELLETREVLSVGRVQVVGKIDTNHQTSGRGVDTHAVRGVVEVLGTDITLDVVRIVITVTKLNINPELVSRCLAHVVLGVVEQAGCANTPLVTGEQKDIGARRVHLVTLSGMDSFLLHGLDAESLELLIEDLTQIHNHRFVDLLPQMGTEDLDEGDLESGNLAVQENAGQIELDLETNVDVGTVDL